MLLILFSIRILSNDFIRFDCVSSNSDFVTEVYQKGKSWRICQNAFNAFMAMNAFNMLLLGYLVDVLLNNLLNLLSFRVVSLLMVTRQWTDKILLLIEFC